MRLFNFGKKKENMKTPIDIQNIKVLGTGCKSCHEMYENTKVALCKFGLDIEVE